MHTAIDRWNIFYLFISVPDAGIAGAYNMLGIAMILSDDTI